MHVTATKERLSVRAYNEVLDRLKRSPSSALISIKGSELESVSGEGLSPTQAREVIEQTFTGYQETLVTRTSSWQFYCFYERLASDKDLCKVYVVVRRPGMLDAIIDGCAEKILLEMRHHDVDEPVEVTYLPLVLYSIFYTGRTAEVYQEWIAKAVADKLRQNHVSVSLLTATTFDCRRT